MGLSVERLTQDKIRWHPDDIANIQTTANKWVWVARRALVVCIRLVGCLLA